LATVLDGLPLVAPLGLLVGEIDELVGEIDELVVGVTALGLVVGVPTEVGVLNDEDEPPEVSPLDDLVVGVLNDEDVVVDVRPFELLVAGVVNDDPALPLESPLDPPLTSSPGTMGPESTSTAP